MSLDHLDVACRECGESYVGAQSGVDAVDVARIHPCLDDQFVSERHDLHERFARRDDAAYRERSEEHTSELQSLMRISYAVFCLKKKKTTQSQYETPVCIIG